MDIQDLRILIRVAAVQNLSVVSAEFGLTPGTVSKRIQAVEDDLGVRLFDRTTRSIRITEEGRTFLEHAERIIDEFETARTAVDLSLQAPRGKLKISAPTRIAGRDTSAALIEFMAAYPEINLSAELTDRPCSLQEEGLDVMIRTGVLPDSALIAKRLAADPQILVASPTYLAANPAPRSPSDLDRHSCLVHGDAGTWSFARKGAERVVRVSGRLRTSDAELLHRAAIGGFGLLRTSYARVAADLAIGRLVPVLEDYDTTGKSAIWAVYPRTRHMLPRMRAFIDFMAEWIRETSETAVAAGKDVAASESQNTSEKSVVRSRRRARPQPGEARSS